MATPKPLILFSNEMAIKKDIAVKIKVRKVPTIISVKNSHILSDTNNP